MLSDVSTLFEHAAPAPARDRRITRRLVDAWARASRGHFPSWTDMKDVDLGDDWDWVFTVDLKRSVGFPYFVYFGERLAKLSDVYLSGETDWSISLLERATCDINAAVAEEGAHFREEEMALCDGRQLQMRSVTAPLADDGKTITHVIGVVSGRIAPPVQLTAV